VRHWEMALSSHFPRALIGDDMDAWTWLSGWQ
jgi:hypothetical protein